jgi:FkbM family methyltransferase
MIHDLIYDVGMHCGNDTEYYLSKGYRVVAIEADPTLCEAQSREHQDAIRDGRLTILNCAIGPKDGTITFWKCLDSDSMGTMDEDIVRESKMRFERTEVEARRLSHVFADFGVPYYLKVDIEGADHYALEAIDPADNPEYVSFEILHLSDLLLLAGKGYSRFKVVDQDSLGMLPPPPPGLKAHLIRALKHTVARKGNGARHTGGPDDPILVHEGYRFTRGCTGPFGEQAAGPWLTMEEAAYAWLAWRQRFPGRNGWFDVHATR